MTSIVHERPLEASEARFVITRVMQHAKYWKDFNVDLMCKTATIIWNIAEVITLKKVVSKQGTEAVNPVLLDKKKKKRNESDWQVNVKKRKLNSVEVYEIVGKRKGKISTKQKVTLKEPCMEKCRLACFKEFTNEVRQKILDDYLDLPNADRKRKYIVCLVTLKEKVRERKRNVPVEKQRNRTSTRTYYLKHPDIDEETRVCQKMFLNTLGIEEKTV